MFICNSVTVETQSHALFLLACLVGDSSTPNQDRMAEQILDWVSGSQNGCAFVIHCSYSFGEKYKDVCFHFPVRSSSKQVSTAWEKIAYDFCDLNRAIEDYVSGDLLRREAFTAHMRSSIAAHMVRIGSISENTLKGIE